jgi:hypothetical protein
MRPPARQESGSEEGEHDKRDDYAKPHQ